MNEAFNLALTTCITLRCTFIGDDVRAEVQDLSAGRTLATCTGNVGGVSLFHNALRIGKACFHIPEATHAEAIRFVNYAQAAG